jgi:hypothetical protein
MVKMATIWREEDDVLGRMISHEVDEDALSAVDRVGVPVSSVWGVEVGLPVLVGTGGSLLVLVRERERERVR